jgi:anti-sigma regulatory factor (Ser/Thr protein kinase)
VVLEYLRERLLCNSGSAARARGILRRLSVPLAGPDLATVSLVLTELVANVVRHGCADHGAEMGVEIQRAPDLVRLEVSQPGPLYDLDAIRNRSVGLERGYGVLLLDRLCRSWGLDHQNRLVWAEIAVDVGR